MNLTTWNNFKKTREHFRFIVEDLNRLLPELKAVLQQFVNSRSDGGNSVYTVETPIVYNTALDDVTINDEIKLILVADNPGRREQAAENKRYLVGPSGKIADKFFRGNPSLGIDFKKNVIILNKTPIHTPRTIELRQLCRIYDELSNRGPSDLQFKEKLSLAYVMEKSQEDMASLLLTFHEALNCPVWITGYSEMRKGGLFEVYTETLKKLYADKKDMFRQIYVYRHFSMNQFTIDLKQQALQGETVTKSLKRIGIGYRQRILG